MSRERRVEGRRRRRGRVKKIEEESSLPKQEMKIYINSIACTLSHMNHMHSWGTPLTLGHFPDLLNPKLHFQYGKLVHIRLVD